MEILCMKTMKWIPWDNVLATGHARLDADHMILVDLFNQLATSIMERKGKVDCVNLLDKIVRHAKAHFEFEQQLMAEHRYPNTEQHTAEHVRLIAQAIKYIAKIEADSPGSHIPVIHFPEDWLTFHILAADRELADFLSTTDATAA